MTVTFFRGHPSNDLLPREEILAAATTVLTTESETDLDDVTRHPLTYGSDPGALSARKTIASWINTTTVNSAAPVEPSMLNLTNGASFGAATALTQCCPREFTRLAFAVSPTYFLINKIFVDAGFAGRMRAVLETRNGLDLDGFEEQLRQDSARFEGQNLGDKLKFCYVLYLVPAFSNPGGLTLTSAENERLLALARKYDVLLLCDHVYDYLDYGKNTVKKTLVALDRATLPADSLGNVIANGSFSKYLGPGLRVGWQEAATPELAYHLSQSGANKSGGTPAHLNSFIAAELIASGALNRILENLNRVYGERARLYRAAMEEHLPAGTTIVGGDGGYFFWLELPDGYDVQAITEECAKENIILAPGQHFEVSGDEKGWKQHCVRVSLSYNPTDFAVPAIARWGAICKNHKRI